MPLAHTNSQGDEADLLHRLWIYTNYDCNLSCSYCVAESYVGAQRKGVTLEQVCQLVEEAIENAVEQEIDVVSQPVGEPPGAVLTDQRAHDATMSGDGPQRRLAGGGEEQARGAGNELVGKAQHAPTVGAGRSRGQ